MATEIRKQHATLQREAGAAQSQTKQQKSAKINIT